MTGEFPRPAAAYHSGQGLVDGLLEKAEYSADGDTLTAFPYEQMNLYVHKVSKIIKVSRALRVG